MSIRFWTGIGVAVVFIGLLGYLYFLYPGQRDSYNAKKHLRESYLSLARLSDTAFGSDQNLQAGRRGGLPPGFGSTVSVSPTTTLVQRPGHWTVKVLGYQIEANFDIGPVVGFIEERIVKARDLVDSAKSLHADWESSLEAAMQAVHNGVLLAFPSDLDTSTNLRECSRKANQSVKEFLRSVDAIFADADMTRELPSVEDTRGNPQTSMAFPICPRAATV